MWGPPAACRIRLPAARPRGLLAFPAWPDRPRGKL